MGGHYDIKTLATCVALAATATGAAAENTVPEMLMSEDLVIKHQMESSAASAGAYLPLLLLALLAIVAASGSGMSYSEIPR